MNCSVVYSWLTTIRYRFGVSGIGSRPAKSLLKPNCLRCAAALWLRTLNGGAPGTTGSPQPITTACRYPSGITTASSLLGATAVKFIPGGAGGTADPPAGSPGRPAIGDVEHAANAGPAALASTVTPAALRAERRDSARPISLTMSPKYSLSLVLGAGWAQASPQR